MARRAASHCCGPLVALGLDRVEKWHWPGLAGAALASSALCLLLIGPGGGGAQDAHFAPCFVAPGLS